MTSNRPYLLRAVHEWICDNGLTPYVVVDAAQPGLQVPPQAMSEDRVVLNLAPRAVAHLEIGNESITFMARFGGVSHAVTVPIVAVQAIYARENGQGMLLAAETAQSLAPSTEPGEQSPPDEPAESKTSRASRPAGPGLQAVPTSKRDSASSGDKPTSSDNDGDPDKPRPKGKPNLHVIK